MLTSNFDLLYGSDGEAQGPWGEAGTAPDGTARARSVHGGGPVADLKVVYVVGPGRSGSTLLADVLAQSPTVVHVGELLWYWKRREMDPPSRCGCGAELRACGFWCDVAEQSPWASDVDPAVIDRTLAELGRSVSWPAMWWQGRSGRPVWPDYAERLTQLYEAIAEVSGARVVVDSSKQPGPALVVAGLERIDARFVHLTRDPRAVVSSWRMPKPDAASPADSLEAIPPLRAALNWNSRALAAELLVAGRATPSRYRRISFESFAAAPKRGYDELMEFIDEPKSDALFLDERTVRLAPSHSIAGNPDRRAGEVREIRLDEAWRARLPRSERIVTTAISAPMMLRLGYGLSALDVRA